MTMYNNKELNESDHHNEAYLKEKMHTRTYSMVIHYSKM
jgi:hypothetical protein